MKQKIYNLINMELSKNSKAVIFLGVLSFISYWVFYFQNINEEYFQNTLIGFFSILALLFSAVFINLAKYKRKVLCWNQCALVVVQMVGLVYYLQLSTMPVSCTRMFQFVFNDYDAYIVTAMLIIDAAAIFVARYFNHFWYSLYAGLKALVFLSSFVFMLNSEYVLFYDIMHTTSYLLYYIAVLILSFANQQ